MVPEPRPLDVIRRRSNGDIRIVVSCADGGRMSDKRSKDAVWVSIPQLMASNESKWTSVNEWEVAFPGPMWEQKTSVAPTQKELDELAEGGAVEVEVKADGETR